MADFAHIKTELDCSYKVESGGPEVMAPGKDDKGKGKRKGKGGGKDKDKDQDKEKDKNGDKDRSGDAEKKEGEQQAQAPLSSNLKTTLNIDCPFIEKPSSL